MKISKRFVPLINIAIIFIVLNVFLTSKLFAQGFIPLSNYQAEYKLKSSKYKLSAKAIRKLNIDAKGNTQLSQKSKIIIAKISQESRFKTHKNSCDITVEQYSYNRKIFGKKNNYHVSFDHNKNQFSEIENDRRQTLNYEDKLYDELSYQEALRCELQNKADIKIGDSFEYVVRTKGKNKTYHFKVNAFETLKNKLGTIKTVKVSRIRQNKDSKSNSHIWFSKDHQYLLVKFRQTNKDDTLSLDIIKAELKS